jgi:3-dehydroquinate synthase
MKIYTTSFGPVYMDETVQALPERIVGLSVSQVFLLADSNTADSCVPLIKPFFPDAQLLVIPAGETSKTLRQSESIWSFLLHHGADRKSLILNVGGGMICDLGGFSAACFQRGIRFIHVPTSLLAMTDAAIGGKVGVDFQGFKNYIGLFHSAEFTWIHTSFLQTLPPDEIRNGLAEIVKHAILGSPALWEKLESLPDPEPANWEEVLALSIPVKIKVIENDPQENGMRKSLNFGHTIGHSLESYFMHSPTPLSHGQCVTLGMLAETKMALDLGKITSYEFDRIQKLLVRLLPLPRIIVPAYDELQTWMMKDKKNTGNSLSFSLPTGIGSCEWDLSGLDPAPALKWLSGQVSGKTIRLMSDPF